MSEGTSTNATTEKNGEGLELRSSEQRRQELEVPEGGLRAWIVVIGASFALFATFGVVNAYG